MEENVEHVQVQVVYFNFRVISPPARDDSQKLAFSRQNNGERTVVCH